MPFLITIMTMAMRIIKLEADYQKTLEKLQDKVNEVEVFVWNILEDCGCYVSQ